MRIIDYPDLISTKPMTDERLEIIRKHSEMMRVLIKKYDIKVGYGSK